MFYCQSRSGSKWAVRDASVVPTALLLDKYQIEKHVLSPAWSIESPVIWALRLIKSNLEVVDTEFSTKKSCILFASMMKASVLSILM